MRIRILILIIVILTQIQSIVGQTTVQIGVGGSTTGESGVTANECFFPVMQSTFYNCPTCWVTHIRSDALWTQAELNTAGIPAGATIISVEFNKRLVGGHFNVPVDHKLFMANSNRTVFGDPIANPIAWSTLMASHTLVYSNQAFNVTGDVVTAAYRWVKWDITPFVYTGGALEIAAELIIPPNSTVGGPISWQRPSGLGTLGNNVIAGLGEGTAAPLLNGTPLTPMRRPNIRITYMSPGECPAPVQLLINNIYSSGADISWSAVPTGTAYEYAITSSPTPPSSGTPTNSAGFSATGLSANTPYYVHVRAKCGSLFSLWKTASFSTVSCMAPSNVVFNLSGDACIFNWNNAIGSTGYQYALTTIATPPANGTDINVNQVQISGLSGASDYYFHVRNNCGTGGYSAWTSITFSTDCFKPMPVLTTTNNKTGSVQVRWPKVPGTEEYEYAILTRSIPPSWSSSSVTTDTSVYYADLAPGLKYYFYLRSHCRENMTSPWSRLEIHASGIEVYPNPTQGNVRINIFGIINRTGTIAVYDVTGNLVRKWKFSGNSTELNMSGINNGIYLVKYENYEGYVTKLIKL